MHTCCAPCLVAPYHSLSEGGMKITAFWFNPNIHPYTEYLKRKEALVSFAEKEQFDLIVLDDYALEEFLINTTGDIGNRCQYCYSVRLEKAAEYASRNGFDAFSSTLLYSRYQKHEMIRRMAEDAANKYDISFYYEDFRPLWGKGIELSKAEGMYRQQYCGCIFSEKDRYLGKK